MLKTEIKNPSIYEIKATYKVLDFKASALGDGSLPKDKNEKFLLDWRGDESYNENNSKFKHLL